MSIRKTPGEQVFDFFNYGFLCIVILVTIYPLYYVLVGSISDPADFMANRGIVLHPFGFTTRAFALVFQNPNILTGYRNTIFYVISGTTINIFLTMLGAYALSRKGFALRNRIMFFLSFTMFFSGGLIASFLLILGLGLFNTPAALILPSAIKVYNLIIMRTAFGAVPDSLEESARMDGAGDFTILFKIIAPLSMPVISVMLLFYGVAHWNGWFDAMIYLKNTELFPLQLILREILIANRTESMMLEVPAHHLQSLGESIKYATIVVATVPILLVYPFLQRYFVKGVMIGAIKG